MINKEKDSKKLCDKLDKYFDVKDSIVNILPVTLEMSVESIHVKGGRC